MRNRSPLAALRKTVSVITALLVLAVAVAAQPTISAVEAKDHIGETVTVCGVVASTKYADSSPA